MKTSKEGKMHLLKSFIKAIAFIGSIILAVCIICYIEHVYPPWGIISLAVSVVGLITWTFSLDKTI